MAKIQARAERMASRTVELKAITDAIVIPGRRYLKFYFSLGCQPILEVRKPFAEGTHPSAQTNFIYTNSMAGLPIKRNKQSLSGNICIYHLSKVVEFFSFRT